MRTNISIIHQPWKAKLFVISLIVMATGKGVDFAMTFYDIRPLMWGYTLSQGYNKTTAQQRMAKQCQAQIRAID